MEYLYWAIIAILFLVSFISLIYPILPGVLFLILGYVLYGVFFSFSAFSIWFWVIQAILVILLFAVDYFSNLFGVKKRGGSRAAIWGSTIGLIIGPFILPFIGIILGPFLGAVLAELLVHSKTFSEAVQVGVGTLFGFLGGVIVKSTLQIVMIALFFSGVVF